MLGSVHKLCNLERSCNSVVCLDIDLSLADRTSLCLDNNGSICASHTINSCSRGIFKHRERLDFLWRELIERALDSIDDHERIRACTECVDTTDPEI